MPMSPALGHSLDAKSCSFAESAGCCGGVDAVILEAAWCSPWAPWIGSCMHVLISVMQHLHPVKQAKEGALLREKVRMCHPKHSLKALASPCGLRVASLKAQKGMMHVYTCLEDHVRLHQVQMSSKHPRSHTQKASLH